MLFAMKTARSYRILAVILTSGIITALAVRSPGSASAETIYNATLDNEVALIYGAIYPNTSPHYDAINFATGNGTVLSVDQDVSFTGSTLSAVFTSTTFTSTGGRVSASMLGVDEFFTPVDGRTFVVQNFALNNVDFTTSSVATGGVELRIQGPGGLDTSLSMANSTLNCAITPHLYAPSAFTFSVSGSSQISGWQGNMASATALSIASGGTFRIKNCGVLNPTAPSETLNFSTDANHAILNNSSLILDASNLRWGSTVGPGSEMTLTNSSTLQLIGQSKLRTQDITLQGSSIAMDNNTRIDVRYNTELDNSAVSIARGAALYANGLVAKGTAMVALGMNGSLNTSTLDIASGATMNVVGNDDDIGEMTVSSEVLFPTIGSGTLVVGNLRAVLNLTNNATMDVTSHASLVNNGMLNQQAAQVTVRQGSTVTNNAEWTVQAGSTLRIDGTATIGQDGGQHGHLAMDGTLAFIGSGKSTLSTINELNLGSTSILQMTLDATARTSDELLIGNGAREFTINNSATLSLSVVNDTSIAIGTKFLLINYPDWQVAMAAHFNGLPDLATFALGLNSYQINYNDGDYRPAEGSTFITLTVVPEPSALTLLGLGALTLASRGLRRRA